MVYLFASHAGPLQDHFISDQSLSIPVIAKRALTLTEDRDPLLEPLFVCPMVVLLNLQGKTCSLFMSFTNLLTSIFLYLYTNTQLYL